MSDKLTLGTRIFLNAFPEFVGTVIGNSEPGVVVIKWDDGEESSARILAVTVTK